MDFKVKPQKQVLGPEHNPWFWNPNLIEIEFAPKPFRALLKREMGEELDITWNPIQSRWQVWTRSQTINHKLCHGWRLLFIHNAADGTFLPLDELIFARLYSCSAEHQGGAKQYFDRMVREMDRAKEKREKQRLADTIDSAMPSFDHSKIQVSGFGKSNGSKFSTYQA